MVMEIKPPKDVDIERDEKVLRMLVEAIKIVGGPRKLIGLRNLTWISSLIRALYTVLLRDAGYTYEEIASKLGVTRATVERIATADPEAVKAKLEGIGEGDIDDHIAGALAKLAYKEMKRSVIEEERRGYEEAAETLGIDWALKTAKMIKGLDFPVDRQALEERLRGVKIYEYPIEEILDRLEYPIDSPAHLIKSIANVLRSMGRSPSGG